MTVFCRYLLFVALSVPFISNTVFNKNNSPGNQLTGAWMDQHPNEEDVLPDGYNTHTVNSKPRKNHSVKGQSNWKFDF